MSKNVSHFELEGDAIGKTNHPNQLRIRCDPNLPLPEATVFFGEIEEFITDRNGPYLCVRTPKIPSPRRVNVTIRSGSCRYEVGQFVFLDKEEYENWATSTLSLSKKLKRRPPRSLVVEQGKTSKVPTDKCDGLLRDAQDFKKKLSNMKDGELPRLFITTHILTEESEVMTNYLAPFRAAVSVGDQVIETDTKGFARLVPSAVYFESPTLICVPMELLPETPINESINQVCKVLEEWNKTNSTSSRDPLQLPLTILKALHLSSPFFGMLENFLTQLVKMDTFRPSFTFRDESIISHAQLDSIVWNLREEDDEDEILTDDEEHFLKAMDRVYWIRYFGILSSSLPEEEKRKVIGNCRPSDCPFGNPAETQTLIGHGIQLPKEEERQYLERLKQLRF